MNMNTRSNKTTHTNTSSETSSTKRGSSASSSTTNPKKKLKKTVNPYYHARQIQSEAHTIHEAKKETPYKHRGIVHGRECPGNIYIAWISTTTKLNHEFYMHPLKQAFQTFFNEDASLPVFPHHPPSKEYEDMLITEFLQVHFKCPKRDITDMEQNLYQPNTTKKNSTGRTYEWDVFVFCKDLATPTEAKWTLKQWMEHFCDRLEIFYKWNKEHVPKTEKKWFNDPQFIIECESNEPSEAFGYYVVDAGITYLLYSLYGDQYKEPNQKDAFCTDVLANTDLIQEFLGNKLPDNMFSRLQNAFKLM